MRASTPGFSGARLREAREARGMTAITLSGLVEISRQAISQFESGIATPQPETFERIAKALNLPPQFFLRPAAERPQATVFFRSLASATRLQQTRAEKLQEWMYDVAGLLHDVIDFPDVDLPAVDLPTDFRALSMEQIEASADEVRRHWGLGGGPISDVVLLLENAGVFVARVELEADELDGLSAWYGDHPFVLLAADKECAVRSRFDAAHELGHLVLHRGVDRSTLVKKQEFRLIENQAHRFAGAFLFPQSSFARELYLPTLEGMRRLKPRWLTSVALMIKRTSDLELLNPEQSRNLWRAYTRKGWRGHEPLDDSLPVEEPRLLRRAVELALGEGVWTPEEILAALTLTSTDLESLANLPRGRLSPAPSPPQVIDLKLRQRPTPRVNVDKTGEITLFRSRENRTIK